ncbi:MAG: hypothetical protein RAK22_00160, partial [Nanoarchaeota archaeon]|nr:hypothetical protein [Nanoarchaeota archaeon]
MEKSGVFGKRGGAGTALLVIIMVAFVIFISLPFISTYLNSFGISLLSGQSKYVGNSTQGVVISDIRYPASVSPLSTFSVTLYVSNNLNGNNADDITLCLDNLGVLNFTNANQYGGSPCVAINNLFAGETVPETFTLRSPSNGAYENIPYAEDVGYYLNYNYTTSFVQPVEFVSENALNSGDCPPVGSFSE